MLYEYAIEPQAIGSSWETFRYIIEKFGFDKGRLISQFPEYWFKEVYRVTKDFPPVQRKRVEVALDQAKKNKSVSCNRAYNSSIGAWLDNALAEHRRKPFRAIIANENTEGQEFVLPTNDLDETHPLFAVAHDCQVLRDTESLASAMSMMLKAAKNILFIDAYYDPFNSKYQNTLRACLRRVQSINPIAICEVHHLDHDRCPSAEAIEREAHILFRTVIPAGMKLVIYRWLEKSGGEDFHARYLLTDKGGIRVDAGFSAEGNHQTTDMTLMAFDVWQSRKRAFVRDADVYDLIDPVLQISSDGKVERI